MSKQRYYRKHKQIQIPKQISEIKNERLNASLGYQTIKKVMLFFSAFKIFALINCAITTNGVFINNRLNTLAISNICISTIYWDYKEVVAISSFWRSYRKLAQTWHWPAFTYFYFPLPLPSPKLVYDRIAGRFTQRCKTFGLSTMTQFRIFPENI